MMRELIKKSFHWHALGDIVLTLNSIHNSNHRVVFELPAGHGELYSHSYRIAPESVIEPIVPEAKSFRITSPPFMTNFICCVRLISASGSPTGAQRITIFAAGIPASSKHPEAAKKLIEWLASPAGYGAIRKSGLEPAKAE